MKIALVSPYDFPYPGGVTEHVIALAEGLRRRGHEAQILAACSGYQNRTFPQLKAVTRAVSTIPVGGTLARVGLSPLSYFKIRKILQAEAFDVIHLQEPLTPSITWLVLLQTQALSKAAVIGTFHAYHEHPNWLYARGRPIFGRFFARLDGLIAVSEAARDFAQQMFPGHYQIIPNGVDVDRFRPAYPDKRGPPDGRLNILFVGRLDWRKGFQRLLDSFLRLKPAYPQLSLTVIGPFDQKACAPYQKAAQAGGVTDIEFVGYVSPEQLAAFYHRVDIFCAPSVGYESFGIVLLEAMAAGLPIVASDIAGYRSVITAGQEGLLVPPGQVPHLTEALRYLINDPALRRQMGRRGQLTASRYNWPRVIDKVLDFYHETLIRKRQPAPLVSLRSCNESFSLRRTN